MLKNIYFTDFDSNKDEVSVKELLNFDNQKLFIKQISMCKN